MHCRYHIRTHLCCNLNNKLKYRWVYSNVTQTKIYSKNVTDGISNSNTKYSFNITNHYTRRNKCVAADPGAVHFIDHGFGRSITWQLIDHAYKLCQTDPKRYCSHVIS